MKPFHFLDVFLCCTKVFFSFDVVLLVYFSFCCLRLRKRIQKIVSRLMSKSLLSMFSSKNFMVTVVTFKPLFYFEVFLFSVYGIRKWSSFFLSLFFFFFFPACSCPVFLHGLLKKQSFSSYYLLYHRLTEHESMDLFPGSLFCSIDLCVCFSANTMLFSSLWLYSIV